jgi:hypothetical protein
VTETPQIPARLLKALNEASTEHLTYEQLEGFVDSNLEATEEAFVRAHMELCGQCKKEMDDLERFSTTRHDYEYSAVAAAASTVPVRRGFWAKLSQWLTVPRHGLALAGAAMAAVILIVVSANLHMRSGSSPAIATTATPPAPPTVKPAPETPRPEAVLDDRSALGARGSNQIHLHARVLPRAEAEAYRVELALAPNDPEARAAIAIKYGLYSEAEKEYLQMQAAGGQQAEKAGVLLENLKRIRALAAK